MKKGITKKTKIGIPLLKPLKDLNLITMVLPKIVTVKGTRETKIRIKKATRN
jgi:hypothetical protein